MWNPHIRLKWLKINIRFRLLLKILDRRSNLSINNKLLIYKTMLKPMWTYETELWGSAKPTNISKIQLRQSKISQTITSAPYYVSNLTLQTDLKISYVKQVAVERYSAFHGPIPHPNPLIQSISAPHM